VFLNCGGSWLGIRRKEADDTIEFAPQSFRTSRREAYRNGLWRVASEKIASDGLFDIGERDKLMRLHWLRSQGTRFEQGIQRNAGGMRWTHEIISERVV